MASFEGSAEIVQPRSDVLPVKEPPEDECCICISSLAEEQDVIELSTCKHFFHRKCIDDWFRRGSNICPYCNQAEGPRTGRQPPGTLTHRIKPSYGYRSGKPSNTHLAQALCDEGHASLLGKRTRDGDGPQTSRPMPLLDDVATKLTQGVGLLCDPEIAANQLAFAQRKIRTAYKDALAAVPGTAKVLGEAVISNLAQEMACPTLLRLLLDEDFDKAVSTAMQSGGHCALNALQQAVLKVVVGARRARVLPPQDAEDFTPEDAIRRYKEALSAAGLCEGIRGSVVSSLVNLGASFDILRLLQRDELDRVLNEYNKPAGPSSPGMLQGEKLALRIILGALPCREGGATQDHGVKSGVTPGKAAASTRRTQATKRPKTEESASSLQKVCKSAASAVSNVAPPRRQQGQFTVTLKGAPAAKGKRSTDCALGFWQVIDQEWEASNRCTGSEMSKQFVADTAERKGWGNGDSVRGSLGRFLAVFVLSVEDPNGFEALRTSFVNDRKTRNGPEGNSWKTFVEKCTELLQALFRKEGGKVDDAWKQGVLGVKGWKIPPCLEALRGVK